MKLSDERLKEILARQEKALAAGAWQINEARAQSGTQVLAIEMGVNAIREYVEILRELRELRERERTLSSFKLAWWLFSGDDSYTADDFLTKAEEILATNPEKSAQDFINGDVEHMILGRPLPLPPEEGK